MKRHAIVNRLEPKVTEKFKKDPEQENFLARLNSILAPYQEEDYIRNLPENYSTLHVIGPPRSGTTLLMQLLASHTDIGYINNLIAAFWKAPVYGIRLSKQVVPPNATSSYQSEFGRTRGVHEPHEFGYFWSELLNYREMREDEPDRSKIDWGKVRLILTNMTHAYQAPIVFKSFLLGWHIDRMQKTLPKTCWIYIRRDPVQNALSILDLRREFLGSVEKWASLKPKEYHWLKKRPYWEQVAGQVYFLEKRYIEQLQNIPSENRMCITYEELCSNPGKILNNIIDMVSGQGNSVNLVTAPPRNFQKQDFDLSRNQDGQKIIASWKELVRSYGGLETI